jgi:hypothetical protein
MGNSSSSSGRGQHEETVDFGYLVPQGVYTGTKDYNQAIVSQLICGRKLAPFYRPLEEYEEKWDDDQILAARKELPDPDGNPESPASRVEPAHHNGGSKVTHSKRSNTHKEPSKPEAAVYRGAVECPICFLVSRHLCRFVSSLLTFRVSLGVVCVYSIIPQILITLDVVTKLYARNVLSRSSGPNLLPLISSPSRPLVRIVYKTISVSCIRRLHGVQELVVIWSVVQLDCRCHSTVQYSVSFVTAVFVARLSKRPSAIRGSDSCT